MDNNSLGQNGLLWGLSRAFYVEQTKTELGVASYIPDSSLDSAYYAHIDASRSSTIYKGSALQPKALSVLPCIRIWCTGEPVELKAAILNHYTKRCRHVLTLTCSRNSKCLIMCRILVVHHQLLSRKLRQHQKKFRREYRKECPLCLALGQTLLDGSAIYRWEQTQDPTSMVRYFKGSNGLLLISCKANMLGIGRCNSTLLVQTQRIRTEQRQCSHLLYRLFHASATNIEYTAVRLKLLAASSSRCRSKNYEKHRKLWHSHY